MMTETETLTAAKQARDARKTGGNPHRERLGQACARLHELGWTWHQIGQAMGVNLSTAWRWAKPYLPPKT